MLLLVFLILLCMFDVSVLVWWLEVFDVMIMWLNSLVRWLVLNILMFCVLMFLRVLMIMCCSL